ncbi:unnamed protein product [Timema podura]|uniref:Exophilin 5 n=1 Tax=Timema podura TaxID=61482 RepID=A0ABN7NV48_TIMPD|nr:unnamed protein product [Timema podura]
MSCPSKTKGDENSKHSEEALNSPADSATQKGSDAYFTNKEIIPHQRNKFKEICSFKNNLEMLPSLNTQIQYNSTLVHTAIIEPIHRRLDNKKNSFQLVESKHRNTLKFKLDLSHLMVNSLPKLTKPNYLLNSLQPIVKTPEIHYQSNQKFNNNIIHHLVMGNRNSTSSVKKNNRIPELVVTKIVPVDTKIEDKFANKKYFLIKKISPKNVKLKTKMITSKLNTTRVKCVTPGSIMALPFGSASSTNCTPAFDQQDVEMPAAVDEIVELSQKMSLLKCSSEENLVAPTCGISDSQPSTSNLEVSQEDITFIGSLSMSNCDKETMLDEEMEELSPIETKQVTAIQSSPAVSMSSCSAGGHVGLVDTASEGEIRKRTRWTTEQRQQPKADGQMNEVKRVKWKSEVEIIYYTSHKEVGSTDIVRHTEPLREESEQQARGSLYQNRNFMDTFWNTGLWSNYSN